jgi:hypothetical protein
MPAAATRYMCVLRTAVFKAYGLLTRLATMRLGVPEFLPHEVSLFIAFSRILRDFNACVNAVVPFSSGVPLLGQAILAAMDA